MKKPSERGILTCERMLKAGIRLYMKDPSLVNATHVGRACKTSHSNVIYHFPYGIKDAVIEYAVQTKNLKIMALLVAEGHKAVEHLSPSERLEYLKILV